MRVQDLAGAALDFWTAKAAGMANPRIIEGVCTIGASHYRPSSSWADGGPLIESARISVWRYPDLESWHACLEFNFSREDGIKAKNYYQGPTPLIAGMRCLIASKFGNEVLNG